MHKFFFDVIKISIMQFQNLFYLSAETIFSIPDKKKVVYWINNESVKNAKAVDKGITG